MVTTFQRRVWRYEGAIVGHIRAERCAYYHTSRKWGPSALPVVQATITCSRVMMNGGSPGARKFGSSARIRA